jgi:hypothetical protein
MGTMRSVWAALAAVAAQGLTWPSFIANLLVPALVFVGAMQPAAAQFTQLGAKLVGTGAIGTNSWQGYSVAVSADDSTMIEGAPHDSFGVGAAWVFTRRGGVWSQQAKIVPSDAISSPAFGTSVALSADGNTAIIGGPDDNCPSPPCTGAAWVFTRSGSTWTEQQKLLDTTITLKFQGGSVALSADGNTAVVGGAAPVTSSAAVFARSGTTWGQRALLLSQDELCPQAGFAVAVSGDGQTAIVGATGCVFDTTGAVWVFTFDGSSWNQQAKLVGANSSSGAQQGFSVALSYDGNAALVGGPVDNSDTGATWVFARSVGVWAQQAKLVGSGGSPSSGSGQGSAVALSADGNTAMSGAANDNSGIGAAWIFSRTGGVWTQRGSKLVGTNVSSPMSGVVGVALSRDGNTAVMGRPQDNASAGATWVFIRTVPTNTHDYDDNGVSDIAWRDNAGDAAIWLMNGAALTSSAGFGAVPTVWSVVGQRDFDGNGTYDLLWHDTSGNTAIWFMNGTTVAASTGIGNIPTSWTVIGTGDFNGDGMGDILWQDNSGNLAVWLMNGATVLSSGGLGNVPTATWSLAGTGDFNGDGKTDLLWRDTSGNTAMWFMNGAAVSSSASVGNIPISWTVIGTGDFNGDGMSDIVWRDTSGNTSIWLMNGAAVATAGGLGIVPTTWSVAQTGDYNADGMSDLLWRDTSGNTAIWFMNGVAVSSTAPVGNIPTNWTVQSVNAE